MKQRRYLTPDEARFLGLKVKKPQPNYKKARYVIDDSQIQMLQDLWESESDSITQDYKTNSNTVLSAISNNGGIMDIDEYCKYYKLPRKDITSFKLITHTGTPFYNIVFKEQNLTVEDIDIEGLIKKHIKPVKVSPVIIKTGDFLFDRLVYTDAHIGMEPNENGFSLYGGKWDEKELQATLDKMVSFVIANKKSNVLIIDDLGDFVDGWNSETVRRQHKLPQNMDNEKAFDVGLSFKVHLIDRIAEHYESIISHNICNDNHAGSFAYVINSAYKWIVEVKYNNVKVYNLRAFINHYIFANNCFILTHGKDGKNLKFGFKPILDATAETKINNYIDEHFLLKDGRIIEFSKGDSHQDIFDNSTSDKFNYYNYPALSPSSEWIQTNYKKGMRGFYLFNYRKDGSKEIKPKYFKWKK